MFKFKLDKSLSLSLSPSVLALRLHLKMRGRHAFWWGRDNKAADGSIIYLLLYVDDKLKDAKSKFDVQKLKTLLNAEFDIKDIGAA